MCDLLFPALVWPMGRPSISALTWACLLFDIVVQIFQLELQNSRNIPVPVPVYTKKMSRTRTGKKFPFSRTRLYNSKHFFPYPYHFKYFFPYPTEKNHVFPSPSATLFPVMCCHILACFPVCHVLPYFGMFSSLPCFAIFWHDKHGGSKG